MKAELISHFLCGGNREKKCKRRLTIKQTLLFAYRNKEEVKQLEQEWYALCA